MPVGPEDGFQLFDEVVDVFELAVNRGKPDERYLVDRSQPIEHFFADIPGGNFAVEALVDVRLDVVEHPPDDVTLALIGLAANHGAGRSSYR